MTTLPQASAAGTVALTRVTMCEAGGGLRTKCCAMQAVGWAQLFSPKASTRDMCAVLWTLIAQQAAREAPPQFLLSGAPKQHTVSSLVPRVRYLLRLSQIRTLYWISDELDRY